jgi:hypothetical protein
MIQYIEQCTVVINHYNQRFSEYTLQMSVTHTITYIQYCLKIKTNGFQTFFGGNGFWRKRETPI